MRRAEALRLAVGAERTGAVAVARHCREAMRAGSFSFFFAARFLAPETRAAVRMLYTWCRHCDDVVDGAVGTPTAAGQTMVLDELRRHTWAAVRGRTSGGTGAPAFAALAALAARHPFPEACLQELLTGMEMDVEGRRYATFEELAVYCHRVAGVVGHLFSHLVGVTGAQALGHAADLGMAMQMTNIARDVLEDHALGRLYLPGAWLAAEGLCEATAFRPENRAALARVTARLLDEADRHYASGDAGLAFLPARSALAVAVARQVYAAIGTIVRRRGPRAWDRRAVVPFLKKLALLGAGLGQVVVTRRIRP